MAPPSSPRQNRHLVLSGVNVAQTMDRTETLVRAVRTLVHAVKRNVRFDADRCTPSETVILLLDHDVDPFRVLLWCDEVGELCRLMSIPILGGDGAGFDRAAVPAGD
jgi:hypothetical protein